MENLFLAIIAFNALLSAVIVGGLAFGMRVVNRKLDELETEVQQDVMPKIEEFVHVARKVADATADARRRMRHADAIVTARAHQVERLLGGTLDRVAGVAEQAAGFAGDLEADADDEAEARGVAR
jgi:hypothetical protein